MLIPSNAFKLLKFLHDKFMKYILCGRSYITAINLTSTPVVRTGVYPHMPITVTANSLQHWLLPSKRRPVSHTVRDGQASLSHRANTVKRVIDFSIFDIGRLTPGQRSPKGQTTYYHLDLPSYKISSLYLNPRPRYPLPCCQSSADKETNKKTNKQ